MPIDAESIGYFISHLVSVFNETAKDRFANSINSRSASRGSNDFSEFKRVSEHSPKLHANVNNTDIYL